MRKEKAEQARNLMEQIKAILATYSGPPTLEHMCPAVGGSALKKWQQLQAEKQPGAVAVKPNFIKRCEEKLASAYAKNSEGKVSKDNMKMPLQVMQDEVREKQDDYILKGDDIPRYKIEKQGGLSRIIDLKSIFKHHLTDKAKQDYGINTSEDFEDLVKGGKFQPKRENFEGQVRGKLAEAWWFPIENTKGLKLVTLKKMLSINDPVYNLGAIRLYFSPDDAMANLKPKKPTVFDGMVQGDERDPLWQPNPNPNDPWGLTRDGTLEAVAPAVDIRKATKITLLKGIISNIKTDARSKTKCEQ